MNPSWKRITRAVLTLSIVTAALGGDVRGWRRVGSAREDFEINLDTNIHRSGNASGRLECIVKRSAGTGTLEQDFSPEAYVEQRIRFTAWIKGEQAEGATIFMRTENSGGQILEFGNARDHAVHGTFDWRKMEVVLDVSRETSIIQMGLILREKGKAWMDDVMLEVVDKHVRSTASFHGPGQANPRRAGMFVDHGPQNLDFEQ